MKIDITKHEREVIIQSLLTVGTLIPLHLAEKLRHQDTAEDGPEVAILGVGKETPWS